jgi:predicted nucleotidyltransferase
MARDSGRSTRPEVEAAIQLATQRLIDAARPQKIVLFGSYARGDFDPRSDLDLLVILPTVENRFEGMVRLRGVLRGIPIPIDLVVASVEQVEERQELRGTMLHECGAHILQADPTADVALIGYHYQQAAE